MSFDLPPVPAEDNKFTTRWINWLYSVKKKISNIDGRTAILETGGSTVSSKVTILENKVVILENKVVVLEAKLAVITKIAVYAVAFDPASVAAATTVEQTITVAGITAADKLTISKPSLTAGLGIVNIRSITDGAVVTFINTTAAAIDAASETYTIVAFRS